MRTYMWMYVDIVMFLGVETKSWTAFWGLELGTSRATGCLCLCQPCYPPWSCGRNWFSLPQSVLEAGTNREPPGRLADGRSTLQRSPLCLKALSLPQFGPLQRNAWRCLLVLSTQKGDQRVCPHVPQKPCCFVLTFGGPGFFAALFKPSWPTNPLPVGRPYSLHHSLPYYTELPERCFEGRVQAEGGCFQELSKGREGGVSSVFQGPHNHCQLVPGLSHVCKGGRGTQASEGPCAGCGLIC